MLFARYRVTARIRGQEVGRWEYWKESSATKQINLLVEWATRMAEGSPKYHIQQHRDSRGRQSSSWMFPIPQKKSNIVLTLSHTAYDGEND